jgi:hypothetical protein
MSAIKILTGKALKAALNGYGKAVSTFKAKEHQLAVSALNHAAEHNDPIYLNALFAATPRNYQAGLRNWTLAFGNVAFDKESGAFVHAAKKAAKVQESMLVAPADYGKESAGKETAFDIIAGLSSFVKRAKEKGFEGSAEVKDLEGILRRWQLKVVKESKESKAA